MQQEELIVEPKKDSTLLDKEKVPQESEILKGAHDVKFNFDECATDQSSRVPEDMKLDEVDKIDTIVLSAAKEKPSLPYIDFVLLDIFSVVEQQTSLFFMLQSWLQTWSKCYVPEL